MPGPLDYYLYTFVAYYKDNDTREVDVSELMDNSNNWSPLVLSYANEEQFEKDLATAVIVNFCKNFTETKVLPKRALDALTSVVEDTSSACIARRVLLLHLTKVVEQAELIGFFFYEAAKMSVRSVNTDDEIEWLHLAAKVIQHEQIIEGIKDSIREFKLRIPDDMEFSNIKISLVDKVTTVLRGFSGLNEIFINANHFRTKFDSFASDSDQDLGLLQLLAKMDIICVTIHELAHVMFRKCANNFNVHTPLLAKSQGLELNRYEFGKYNEIRIFNKQIDWFVSHLSIDVSYMERFIASVENGNMLPADYVQGGVERAQCIGCGLDLQMPVYVC